MEPTETASTVTSRPLRKPNVHRRLRRGQANRAWTTAGWCPVTPAPVICLDEGDFTDTADRLAKIVSEKPCPARRRCPKHV